MKRNCFSGVIAATSLLALAGCATNDPLPFMNAVKKITATWSADSKIFAEMIRKQRDPGRLRADHKDLVSKITSLVAEANTLKVPPGREAQELWTALQTYLKDEENIVSKDFKELIGILGDPTPDLARYQAILTRCQQTENADLGRLHQAEAAYATVHGMASR